MGAAPTGADAPLERNTHRPATRSAQRKLRGNQPHLMTTECIWGTLIHAKAPAEDVFTGIRHFSFIVEGEVLLKVA